MENVTLENIAVVLKFIAYIGSGLGAITLVSLAAARWWETDESHRKEVAPLKARVLRRQREAAREKTDK
ncbi:hypothetical protein [Selenomonas sp. AB3002]|uniref:hypothetical protein n=1 Tax=Selenomonas sp. AB3002 TaxID=1392502 RepID=UPI0004951CE6